MCVSMVGEAEAGVDALLLPRLPYLPDSCSDGPGLEDKELRLPPVV